MSDERKEWVSVSSPAKGPTLVRVTLAEGALSARVAVRSYGFNSVKAAVKEARAKAEVLLTDIFEAVTE